MKRSFRHLLYAGTIVAAAFAGTAHSDTVGTVATASSAVSVPELPLVGSGTLKWYGLRIYDVEYREAPNACTPRILRITYARRIPTHRLIKATREQWQEIGVADDSAVRAWLREAGALWPDIEPGDHLLLLVDSDGASHFFGSDGFLGTIQDPAFGTAFIAIWLSPDTTEPKLRAQLLEGGSSCPVISF